MQLKLHMSRHLLNIYTKFQIDISKHVEEKSGKRGRTDGQTDRRTDGRTYKKLATVTAHCELTVTKMVTASRDWAVIELWPSLDWAVIAVIERWLSRDWAVT